LQTSPLFDRRSRVPGTTASTPPHLDVLGALLLKLGYAPVAITNMAWVKLVSDGTLMHVEDTGGIEFERQH
jgi:hypothetical protein